MATGAASPAAGRWVWFPWVLQAGPGSQQRCPHQEGSSVAQMCSRQGADSKPVVTCSPFTGRARTGHAVRPAENPARGWVSKRREPGTAGLAQVGPWEHLSPEAHTEQTAYLVIAVLQGEFHRRKNKGLFNLHLGGCKKKKRVSEAGAAENSAPGAQHPSPTPSQPAGPSGWHHPPPPLLPPPHPCSQGQACLPCAHCLVLISLQPGNRAVGRRKGPAPHPTAPAALTGAVDDLPHDEQRPHARPLVAALQLREEEGQHAVREGAGCRRTQRLSQACCTPGWHSRGIWGAAPHPEERPALHPDVPWGLHACCTKPCAVQRAPVLLSQLVGVLGKRLCHPMGPINGPACSSPPDLMLSGASGTVPALSGTLKEFNLCFQQVLPRLSKHFDR